MTDISATPFTPPIVNVEEKLFQNRYRVDTGKPHIKIIDATKCAACDAKPCVTCCPAGCWSLRDGGKLDLVVDGCLECGTCRLVCDESNVDWNYPRGGFGILYKFG